MTEVVGGAPAVPSDTGQVARVERSRIATVRAIVELLVAVASLVMAALFADHGVRVDTFPPYVAGDTETHITQFSGPWVTAAFGMLALAGLLIVAAVSDLRPPALRRSPDENLVESPGPVAVIEPVAAPGVVVGHHVVDDPVVAPDSVVASGSAEQSDSAVRSNRAEPADPAEQSNPAESADPVAAADSVKRTDTGESGVVEPTDLR